MLDLFKITTRWVENLFYFLWGVFVAESRYHVFYYVRINCHAYGYYYYIHDFKVAVKNIFGRIYSMHSLQSHCITDIQIRQNSTLTTFYNTTDTWTEPYYLIMSYWKLPRVNTCSTMRDLRYPGQENSLVATCGKEIFPTFRPKILKCFWVFHFLLRL